MTTQAPATKQDSSPVFVFAPAPLVRVTIEQRNDVPDVHLHAGGQGFWVARMIASLGVPTTLCGSFGGETGRVAEALIEHEGVGLRAVQVASANAAHVHDRRDGSLQPVAEMPSPPLSRHEVDELYSTAVVTALDAGVCVLGGMPSPQVLPADIYRRLATDLAANGKTVVADLAGDPLHAALEGGLFALKIADDELQKEGLAAGGGVDDIVGGMRRLRAAGAANVVVSRAGEPALALIDDQLVEVRSPPLEPAETSGAGDSMTAGIAVALARGDDLGAGVRLGAAAGSLNVTRRGLGTGPGQEIERLAEEVTLHPVDVAAAERQ